MSLRLPALLLALGVAPLGAAAQTSAPVVATAPTEAVSIYGYEVVRTYPHDPAAFTQGLEFHDGVLLESTGRSPSTVRRVRLEDGVVQQQRELDPALFGEGLTVVGDRLFTLTWRDQKGFIWNVDDLSPIGGFAYEGEGWGLTHDGARLILSDGTSDLRFLDPTTLSEIGKVAVTLRGRPVAQLNELEWIDGQVFANIWQTDVIVRIDPASGKVVGVIDLRGLWPAAERKDPNDDVLNGIAWDPVGRRLFVTGKNWPRLYEIRLTGPR